MTSSETRALAVVARAKILRRNGVPLGDSQWKHLVDEARRLPTLNSRMHCYEEILALLCGRSQ